MVRLCNNKETSLDSSVPHLNIGMFSFLSSKDFHTGSTCFWQNYNGKCALFRALTLPTYLLAFYLAQHLWRSVIEEHKARWRVPFIGLSTITRKVKWEHSRELCVNLQGSGGGSAVMQNSACLFSEPGRSLWCSHIAGCFVGMAGCLSCPHWKCRSCVWTTERAERRNFTDDGAVCMLGRMLSSLKSVL